MDSISFYKYLNLMKFDFCLLIFAISTMLQNVVTTQLMEDKLCLNQLKLGDSFCSTFASHPNTTETQKILQGANSFKNWQFVIVNAPALLFSIFIGYWLGNYPRYFKLMLTAPMIGSLCLLSGLLVNTFIFEAHWWFMLLAHIPYALSGGVFLIFSAVYSSIPWGTPIHLVIVRFAVIEFFVKISMMSSSYASGKLLDMNPWFHGQRKNYAGVFIVSLVLNFLALLLALLMKTSFPIPKEPEKDSKNLFQVVNDVFRLSRVNELAAIFVKKRPNHKRSQLALLISSVAICTAALNNEDSIAYQFAQRVYGLTEEAYTSMLTLVYIPPTIVTSLGPAILKSFFGLYDSSIAIIGSTSLALFFVIRGVFLSIKGYITGYVVGSFARVSSVALRSVIVATVEPAECAQIFTLTTALETFVGLGATFLYTSVFSFTIDKQPGIIMILIGCISSYPLFVSCWVRVVQYKFRRMKKGSIDNEKNRLIFLNETSNEG
ncbi:uncharacterized protein LOC107365637 [Tetranychus urticae]|uniref:Major facilitator superfamily (MFS) profile domain-containing protein n=1 Tax=Tetranychus urticae TaxID=32264 RepID=T1KMB7_TETUR|nr:uncharacterized protein LOC107365637 [Tetranychus urticae]